MKNQAMQARDFGRNPLDTCDIPPRLISAYVARSINATFHYDLIYAKEELTESSYCKFGRCNLLDTRDIPLRFDVGQKAT